MSRDSLLFLLTGALIITLIITNPSTEDFKEYLKEEMFKEYKEQQESGGILADLLAKGIAGVVVELASTTTQRDNYYLFSIYTVKLDTSKPRKFLGIAGHFIPLN